MLIIALSVAGCAGYFSVWGLSQLFAGASLAVIIMASILEVGKIITTTALHKYWSKINRTLKIYLTTSVAVLMLITSAGIYGFLSNAYQKTADKLEIHEGELAILEAKKVSFQKSIEDNGKIVITKNKRIDQLTNLRNNQEIRIDSAKSNKAKATARGDIQLATNEIQNLSKNIDEINVTNNILSDSVNKYNIKELELKAGSSVAGEVGPLKYISQLTGQPMGKVVNFLIILLIIVFDPLAIALILITNRVFELDSEPKLLVTNKNEPESKLDVPTDIAESITSSPIIDIEKIESKEPIKENDVVTEPVKDELDIALEKFNGGIIEGATEGIIEEAIEVDEPEEEIVEITEDVKSENPATSTATTSSDTGGIRLEDIKEIIEGGRGYSVQVPQPKTNNAIERIGANKVVKNGDSNKVYYKRK